MKLDLNWSDVDSRAATAAHRMEREHSGQHVIWGYAIPNGGIPAALAIARHCSRLCLVEQPHQAHVFLDDIVDSGKTREDCFNKYGAHPFYTLANKLEGPDQKDVWISFPWERMTKQDGPQDNIIRLLQYIGEDPARDGLRGTPDRVVKSYGELFAGYKQKPEDMLTVFEKDGYDEMVVLRSAEFASTCEHHMLPFFGTAHIAYIPYTKVVGISKLVRVLEVFTRRLQIQERICEQVTASLMKFLQPKGAACVLEAKHLCMCHRGVQKQGSVMVTSSLKGAFLEKPEARAEFFNLIRG